jgi:hypothetical protein
VALYFIGRLPAVARLPLSAVLRAMAGPQRAPVLLSNCVDHLARQNIEHPPLD